VGSVEGEKKTKRIMHGGISKHKWTVILQEARELRGPARGGMTTSGFFKLSSLCVRSSKGKEKGKGARSKGEARKEGGHHSEWHKHRTVSSGVTLGRSGNKTQAQA